MAGRARLLVVFAVVCLAGGRVQAEDEHQHAHPGGGAKLEAQDDSASRVLTVRLGPLGLPANGHASVPGSFLTIPFDAWLVAFHPRVVDDRGAGLPGRLLHHVDFFNTARRNFLCPRYDEVFFASGGEMTAWPALSGVGYRVARGDRIRMNAMFHNSTGTPFASVYFEVRVQYKLLSDGPLRNVYPAFLSVTQCLPTTDYDLEPGASAKAGEFSIGFPGTLLRVGGHLHDYGKYLYLENVTRSEAIAKLDSDLDADGRLLSVAVAHPSGGNGHKLHRGDVVRLTATYDNPTGKRLPKGAMGIAFGHFVPDDEEAYARAMTKGSRRPN